MEDPVACLRVHLNVGRVNDAYNFDIRSESPPCGVGEELTQKLELSTGPALFL